MSKLEERESRRRSAVGKFVEQTPMAAASSGRRGRPKENRELKKRISLSVLPSLYEGYPEDCLYAAEKQQAKRFKK
mgnify:CR=1 FL=1